MNTVKSIFLILQLRTEVIKFSNSPVWQAVWFYFGIVSCFLNPCSGSLMSTGPFACRSCRMSSPRGWFPARVYINLYKSCLPIRSGSESEWISGEINETCEDALKHILISRAVPSYRFFFARRIGLNVLTP